MYFQNISERFFLILAKTGSEKNQNAQNWTKFRSQSYKTFLFFIVKQAWVFVSGKILQPSLLFLSKVRAYAQIMQISGALIWGRHLWPVL